MADGTAPGQARRPGEGTLANAARQPERPAAEPPPADQSSSNVSSEQLAASLQQGEDRYQEIQALAHKLWKIRGEPIGSPDVDWAHAEDTIRKK
jgi:hypothetical protein